eukprot:jgi/Hompol1/460/HPOL_005313-RA
MRLATQSLLNYYRLKLQTRGDGDSLHFDPDSPVAVDIHLPKYSAGAARIVPSLANRDFPPQERPPTEAPQLLHTGNTADNSLVATVQHQPLCFSLLTKQLFLLPNSALYFPTLAAQGIFADNPVATTAQSPLSSLRSSRSQPEDTKSRELASSIATLLDALDVRDELFALGQSSRQIARQIVSQSVSASRRSSQRSAAVIIVDRTLDLVAPTMHSDNLLDQIWTILPRLGTTSVDVSVKSQFAVPPRPELDTSDPVPPLLSLAHGLDQDCIDLISALLRVGQKDGLIAASTKAKWNDLVGIEKALAVSLAETMDPTFVESHLCDLLARIMHEKQQRKHGTAAESGSIEPFTVKDVLMLTLYAYALLGDTTPLSQESEAALQAAFVRTMAAKPHPSQFPNVILIVVGGITFEEAGKVLGELSAHGHQVLVGSTNIATTETMMANIFKSK